MKNVSAADVAAKWQQNAGAATTYWQNGINAVTVAPGQAAAAQKNVWLQNVTAAADTWASNTAAVPLSTWKSTTLEKGASRYSGGIQAGATKYQTAIAKILSAESAIVGTLPARGNVQQNIARSGAFQLAMHNAAANGAFK